MKPARIVGGRFVAERDPFDLTPLASFRAVDPDTLERVVVVEPHHFVQDDEHYVDLFQRAVAELASLDPVAPRVLHVFGRGTLAQAVVIEDVEGLTLDRVLSMLRAQRELLPIEVAMAIVHELVALFRSPVRLQLGSDDVVITPEGHVRAKPELHAIQARQTVGAAVHFVDAAVAYLAPEDVRGLAHSIASDMYTLGVLLYELIASRHPHVRPNDTMFEMLSRIQKTLPPPIQAFREVPPEVVAFLERALHPDPTRRFDTWDELVGHLPALPAEQILAAMPVPPEREPPISLGDWRALPDDGLVPVAIPPLVERYVPLPRRASIGAYHYGNDQRPMLVVGALLVDVAPVTAAEYQRFLLALEGPDALDPDAGETAHVGVSHRRAEMYAAWAGKRLPSEAEWTSAIEALGNRVYNGEVWEWTATPAVEGGFVVCGGRWRNALDRPASPQNRSFETVAADDVGVRCVQDRRS